MPVEQDYSRFKKEVEKSTRSLFKIDKKIEPFLKKSHKSTYAIAIILEKLKKDCKNENEIIFLVEILSDILTVTKLLFIGFEMPAMIILRRLTENFYNHIYYFDHSIEYKHLNLGKNEYTPIDKLKQYLDNHPNFIESKDPTIKEYNQNIFNEYQYLCKIVHTKGIDSMNLANCLKDLRNEFEINNHLKKITNIQLYIIYIIYKFHKKLKFTAIERGIIIDLVPSVKRGRLND